MTLAPPGVSPLLESGIVELAGKTKLSFKRELLPDRRIDPVAISPPEDGLVVHASILRSVRDSCLSQAWRIFRRTLPSVARIEINRQELAENVTPEKVRALQRAPVELIDGAGTLIIEGPSIVVARAWITDPDAWKQLAQSVRAGTVRRFDATQLQLTD